MLETSYSRIGAQFGVLNEHVADELAPAQLLSIPASFGRAVVADKVPPQDAAIWEAGLRDAANDHRYYELTHHALQDQFRSEEHTSELQSHSELVCRLL